MATSPNFIQPTNSNLVQDYIAMLLNDRYVTQSIVEIRPQFNKLHTLIDKTQGSPIFVNKMLIEQPFVDSAMPVATCNGVSLSASNSIATITITGNTKDIFAKPFSVRDNVTQTEGKILSHSATTLVVSFVASGTSGVTAFTASDFATGNNITQTGVAHMDFYTEDRTTENLYRLPNLRSIALGTVTKSITLSQKDMIELQRIEKEINGVQYLAWKQVMGMMSDYYNGLEEMSIYSNRVLPNSLGDGGKAASLPWQIKNEDGVYIPMGASPNEQTLMDIIEQMREKTGHGGEYTLLPGTDFVSGIQKAVSKNWITYTGKNNTFGGASVDGIDVDEYTFMGTTLKIVKDFNDFNHPQWDNTISTLTGKRKSASSCLLLNTSPVQTSMGEMLPWCQTYVYGKPGTTIGNGGYRVIENGTIDQYGNALPKSTGTTPVVGYQMESTMANVLTDPTKHAFAELSE